VGIVPFAGTDRTCVIACSKEAKRYGVKNVMLVPEAKAICPDIVLVPQTPNLYRRAHNALLAEIETVIPIDAIKSIDELSCRLDEGQRKNPEGLASMLKAAIADGVGEHITCSIGFAANRQLAKIACKMDKPDGVTIWRPEQMPRPLFTVPLDDIPGVGSRMQRRLSFANIDNTEALYRTQPKQLRALWRNVTGEWLWYALHGYDIQAPGCKRGMFGHAHRCVQSTSSLRRSAGCRPQVGNHGPAQPVTAARSAPIPRPKLQSARPTLPPKGSLESTSESPVKLCPRSLEHC
jgi:DNA polymerase-4